MLNWLSSEADLMTIPDRVDRLVASTGLISIAMEACLNLDEGSFNRKIPAIFGNTSHSL
jgi:hypothetical protein